MPDVKDEFDDLVAQLEADKPRIDPVFARRLDERAAAGFPRRRRRLPFPKVPLFIPAGGLAAAAVAVVVAVSVVGGGDDTTFQTTSDSGEVAATAPEPSLQSGEMDRLSGGSAAAPAQPPGLSRDRLQTLSAALTLEVASGDVGEVSSKVLEEVERVGGFVESSSVRSTDGGSGGGSFQLRVPVDRLDQGLAALSRLGHVAESNRGSQDITANRNVAREALDEGLALRRSLLKRLEDADTDAEAESLRAQLDAVNARIADSRAQLRRVERQAAYATVDLTLTTTDDGAATGATDDEWTPRDALRDAGRVLEVVAGVAVVVLAVLLPLALLGVAAAGTRRLFGRRGRERALDAI